ncbi:MAG: SpoIID/LytB domain-containing protein [Actinobacteria bacterium]|nr:SpoIID/LytB domain-containing protein [Actinomycetota bacterium]MBV8396922.1 SpoIID/LytB domain-containing protein [Actinomycetota bacterium]
MTVVALLCAFAVPGQTLASSLFVVKGGGWGNGVGMSQWGAEGYALHGWSYRRILSHYYPHTTIANVAQQPVRVLVAESKPTVTIASGSPYLLVDATGRKVHVPAKLLPLTPRLLLGKKPLVPPVAVDPGVQPLSVDGVAYRGALTVLRTGGTLSVVNTVPLERYLRGVVPSEMPGRWNTQAYEAQAVAARSYALADLNPSAAFDLYADNRSQMYGGIPAEQPMTDAAVEATHGEALLYDGRVITAYYDSNSGGRTAPVQDVFAGMQPVPYLVSVSDPYDSLSPNHRWQAVFAADSLSRRFGMTVTDVRVTHDDVGVAQSVVLLGPHVKKTLTAAEFAQALSLRSVFFSVSVASLGVTAYRPLRLAGFLRGLSGVVLQEERNGVWRQVRDVHTQPNGRFRLVLKKPASAYRLAIANVAGPPLALG